MTRQVSSGGTLGPTAWVSIFYTGLRGFIGYQSFPSGLGVGVVVIS
jgi:hypothetical protein